MKKTANEIQSEIDALHRRIEIINQRAAADGRAPSNAEKLMVRDTEAVIASLQDQLDHMPEKRLTVQLGGGRTASGGPTVFNSFGEQLRAIRDAGVPGGRTDDRLYRVANAYGLNETVPSEGGFLVESQFASEILHSVFETGMIGALCRRVQIGGNSSGIKFPGVDESSRATGSRWGGVQSYWTGEAEEKTKSQPKFRQIELSLKKNTVLIYTSDELLQDSLVLENFIRKAATDELAFALDDAIINGTGIGQPLGVLNSGALVTQDAESQTAGTIVPENLSKMWARLLPSAQRTAVWLINSELWPQLHLLSIEGAAGGLAPLFVPPGGFSAAPYGTIFGRPVMPIEQCAAPDTAGDIILGDFTNGYLLAEKGGVQADVSIHVRFVYDESVFRFVMRVDGQPVLAAPISPFKGTATQSHFVTLAGGRSA